MLIPNDALVEHANCGQTPMLARPQQIVPSSWQKKPNVMVSHEASHVMVSHEANKEAPDFM
jgi:hypothetical protein